MLKILLCLQKKKKKFAISLFYISFTTLNYLPSIPGARFVASFQRRKWNLFTYSWMKNTSLAWIERGHDRAHGAVVHASLCHRFPFHPFSRASLSPSPLPPSPLTRAKFIASGEKFRMEFNRPISLSQFDVCEKIKTSRGRGDGGRGSEPIQVYPANVIVGREMHRKRRVYPSRFPTVFLRIKRATYRPRFIRPPIPLPATDFIQPLLRSLYLFSGRVFGTLIERKSIALV